MELALKTTATTAPRSEQALVLAARGGDDRAFEQLYSRYRERVTAFIHSKVRDHGRAEDISQEVFMAALRQLRSHDQQIAFKPWIFAIAKNACIDEFRRCARGREVPVETDDDFPADGGASLSIVPSPPAAIESKQRLTDLQGAFGGLSESHHRLLVMRELEGRSYDEIGNRLGMTRQMVESSLFRARRKLSEEYDELASGRRCEQVQSAIDLGAALTARTLGIKERRRLTQHLSHCQGCRQQARLAGIDEALLKPRSIAARIAALLPFGGVWRWPWRRGGSAQARAHASGHLAASGAAQAAGAAGTSITIGQAAAAVAALAVVGAGGGVALAEHTHHHSRPAAAHVGAPRARGTGTGTSAGSAARATAGSSGAGASGSANNTFRGPSRAVGSTPGSTPVGAGSKLPGTTSSTPGQKLPIGGASSTTPTSGTAKAPSSPAGSATSPLKTTVNHPDQTLGKVTAPVKKIVDPITKAIDPILAPVKKVLSSPIVKSVTDPVVAPVKKVLSSPIVKTVTGPVKSVVTNPVKAVTGPVKSVVTNPVKAVTGPVKSVVTNPVKTVTDPIKSVTAPVKTITNPVTNPVTSAPPVKKVGSTVGGVVQKVLPPTSTTSTTPAGTSSGSGSSQSPLTTVTQVLGGP